MQLSHTHQFRFAAIEELPVYRESALQLAKDSWPEFMWHDRIAQAYWHEFFDRFARHQSLMIDVETNQVVAVGHSFPFHWGAPLSELPDEGWDWVIQKAVDDDQKGVKPNLLAAVFVGVRAEYKKIGLSRSILLSFQPTARAHGFKQIVIPVRPNEKPKYPLISMDDYLTWKNEAGAPFDAWLRIQARAGATFIKVCQRSKVVSGSRAEWEAWTGMKFPQSGQYIIPGALAPMRMDADKDEGVYAEPNVWTLHESG
ncbi:MAG: GNAT family N-acetyltransferase [Anaerolineales bacterium]|nr:GNAT family N-acetyltransferase [Anaerolineales bacterium]MCL4261354.1 hypothetical protein [Anaerolineales bacterium]